MMQTLTLLLKEPFWHLIAAMAAILGFVGLNGLVLVYMERKVAGFVQRRPGPYEVGPQGLLQPLADAVKLVAKQLVTPKGADKTLYWAAPILAFMPAPLLYLPIPWSSGATGMDLNVGLLLILAFAGFNVISLILAGWASNNKYGLLGAARAVAQSVAYEIPMLIIVLCIAMQTGSLNLSTIAESQSGGVLSWNIFVQPLAFIIYLIAITAETNRAPFDLPEAESELTAGFHTEYSGMGFGLFFLAEYANMIVCCAVATVLFLGGANGPFVNGPWIGLLWFLAKVYFLMFVLMMFRWTFPRVRFDQLLTVCWRWLIPLSLANLLATAFLVKAVG